MADKESKGLLGCFLSLGVQEKLIMLMVVGLIVAAGFLGYFYGQLKAIRGGSGTLGAANVPSGNAAGQEAVPGVPEQPTSVSDDVWKELLVGAAAEKGVDDARVVMVEFTDYQCPFCARHVSETDPKIQADYVDTGKVRYLIRDLPLPFHANAHVAAQAARCAGDQGKYWEMHDSLFENQVAWSEGDAETLFSGYAGELGMNVGTFDSCLSSGKYKSVVEDDVALAGKAGASGTPTFAINGELLVGAQPISAFKAVLDRAL